MVRNKPVMERFAQYVMPEPNTGCHLWTGELNSTERPRFNVVCRSSVRKQVRVLAARWVGEAKYGPLPAGWHIHHECENPLCVNPDHLVPIEGREHNSMHSQGDGFCPNGHEYAEHGYYRPSGPRAGQLVHCKTCRKAARKDAR